MPVPPEPPDDSECCGRGCERCVWTIYEDALVRYEAALAAWLRRHPESHRDGPGI